MSETDERQSDPRQPRQTSFWGFLFRDRLPLEKETCWFILVSVFDFFATYLLLRRGGAGESNPVARWFLYGWGWKGLLFYKLALVAFVCVIVQLIALKSEQSARRVLLFGIAVVTAVVIYSVVLLARSGGI